jgi:outer membrane protein TolC
VRGIILAALLVPVAAGCVSPVDQKAEVATWRAVIDEGMPAELEPLAPGEALTLPRALALANRIDERLASSGEEYLQALIDRRRQAALLYPEIGIAPTAFVRQHASGQSIPGSTDHHVDVPVQALYNDFQPWSQVASLERSAATIEARRALLLDARAALLLQVAQAFYAVLSAESQSEVLQSSLEVQEERVRDVEAQSQVGFARALDVAQARAQAASTRVLLVNARSSAVDARGALALLLGATRVDGPLQDELAVPAQPGDPSELQARALELRQDLAAAQAESAAALHGVDVAVGQAYPGVSLNLSYFLYRETLPDESLWAALVSVNLPIFSFGRIQADVRAAWSVFRQARDVESLLRRRVAQEVQTAHDDLHASEERLAALDPQLSAAQEAFEQASDLVRAGKATNLERLVAQSQLLVAQLGIADARYARKLAWVALKRAAGTLDLGLQ